MELADQGKELLGDEVKQSKQHRPFASQENFAFVAHITVDILYQNKL